MHSKRSRLCRFQFTPLREGRRAAMCAQSKRNAHFNSRPSARGDRLANPSTSAARRFQFTPLREGRRVQLPEIPEVEPYFNSRPSARGDVMGTARVTDEALVFQFTPLREGRQKWRIRRGRKNISIHAPPRGATKLLKETRGEVKYFNSRPSARGDELNSFAVHPTFISIHAPPRGATDYRVIRSGSATVFQFTPLREGRLAIIWRWMCLSYFNSRPSARGDGNVWAF